MNYETVFLFCCLHFIVFFTTLVATQRTSSSDDNIWEDGYGVDWMYFPDGDDIPRRISLKPFPPESDMLFRSDMFQPDLEYRLYTKYNPEVYCLLDDLANPINCDNQIVKNLHRAPIKIVTHGWESSANKSAVINIKNAYLEMQDVNVVGVDWSNTADFILYPFVALKTWGVGEALGKFIDALNDNYNVNGDQIHLIGHSLGAHIMGKAGSYTKLNISRITGLDPARPLFEYPSVSDSRRLDRSDAQFVDVIHTCGGVLGVLSETGHADFYPNSGNPPQPGCGDITNLFEACSHSRSHLLFAESIRRPNAFPAYSCDNWLSFTQNECRYSNTYMGLNVNRSAWGTFYLKTNDAQPYGRGI